MALAEYDVDQFRALPFNRQIPDNTPVTGAHLQSLRMQRGWSIQEAAFHFGTTITAWCTMVKRENEHRPVPDPALALLVRLVDAFPDLVPYVRAPSASQFVSLLGELKHTQWVSHSLLSVALGRQASTVYRWVTTQTGEPTPTVDRILAMLYPMLKAKDGAFWHAWIELVEIEGKARGIEDVLRGSSWGRGRKIMAKPVPIPAPEERLMHLPKQRQIPDDQPVVGDHLQMQRLSQGWRVIDALVYFGITPQKWCMLIDNRKGQNRQPVKDPSLALLVRLYDAYPDQVAVFRVPSMAEFHDLLKRQPHSAGVTPYQLSLALGRENSSCYRWLQVAKAKTTPVIDRIVTMLQPKLLETHGGFWLTWMSLVEIEARARGLGHIWDQESWGMPSSDEPEDDTDLSSVED